MIWRYLVSKFFVGVSGIEVGRRRHEAPNSLCARRKRQVRGTIFKNFLLFYCWLRMFKIPSDCRRFSAHCSRRLSSTLRSNAATELADKAQRGRWDICVVIALGDHCDPRTWPCRRTNTSQSKDTDSSSKQAHRVKHIQTSELNR